MIKFSWNVISKKRDKEFFECAQKNTIKNYQHKNKQ